MSEEEVLNQNELSMKAWYNEPLGNGNWEQAVKFKSFICENTLFVVVVLFDVVLFTLGKTQCKKLDAHFQAHLWKDISP